MRGLKDAKARYQKGRQSSPNRQRRNDSFARTFTLLLAHKKEEGEEQTQERRARRAERKNCKLDSLHFYRVADGRDGREKGRALGETRQDRKEKREDPCKNNEQLNCNCTATGFALSRVEQQREKRE